MCVGVGDIALNLNLNFITIKKKKKEWTKNWTTFNYVLSHFGPFLSNITHLGIKLGIIFDDHLKFDNDINSIAHSCFILFIYFVLFNLKESQKSGRLGGQV